MPMAPAPLREQARDHGAGRVDGAVQVDLEQRARVLLVQLPGADFLVRAGDNQHEVHAFPLRTDALPRGGHCSGIGKVQRLDQRTVVAAGNFTQLVRRACRQRNACPGGQQALGGGGADAGRRADDPDARIGPQGQRWIERCEEFHGVRAFHWRSNQASANTAPTLRALGTPA